jgi:hypothetical protein
MRRPGSGTGVSGSNANKFIEIPDALPDARARSACDRWTRLDQAASSGKRGLGGRFAEMIGADGTWSGRFGVIAG